MLSREQLLHLFNRFALLSSEPDVKKRIANAVKDGQVDFLIITISHNTKAFCLRGLSLRYSIWELRNNDHEAAAAASLIGITY
uniref:Uncharacterized protein n=1 Tax=Rhizophora mucronata TaxID=61149 RepID=A0A2P2IZ82_RHIMU